MLKKVIKTPQCRMSKSCKNVIVQYVEKSQNIVCRKIIKKSQYTVCYGLYLKKKNLGSKGIVTCNSLACQKTHKKSVQYVEKSHKTSLYSMSKKSYSSRLKKVTKKSWYTMSKKVTKKTWYGKLNKVTKKTVW